MESSDHFAARAVALAVVRNAGNAGNTPALQQLVLAAALSALVLAFISKDWLWRWGLLLYDVAASIESAAVADDLIIVAIDDESLSRIGRWPWPRSVHAQLVRRLHADGAKVIGLDILFAEADSRDPQGDAAIADSARTVLPVVMELPRLWRTAARIATGACLLRGCAQPGACPCRT